MSTLIQNPARPEGKGGEQMLERMNRSHKPLRDWGLAHIEWRPSMRILDIGCGGGATIADMLELSDNSFIDGIDYAEKSVEMSLEMNKAYIGERCAIQQGDVQALPYEDNKYDLVTAVETVYFWPDIKGAFAQISRILKRKGELLILCEASEPDNFNSDGAPDGMVVYTPEQLSEMLLDSGFCSVRYDRGEGEYICVIAEK